MAKYLLQALSTPIQPDAANKQLSALQSEVTRLQKFRDAALKVVKEYERKVPVVNRLGEREFRYTAQQHSHEDQLTARARCVLDALHTALEEVNRRLSKAMENEAAMAVGLATLTSDFWDGRALVAALQQTITARDQSIEQMRNEVAVAQQAAEALEEARRASELAASAQLDNNITQQAVDIKESDLQKREAELESARENLQQALSAATAQKDALTQLEADLKAREQRVKDKEVEIEDAKKRQAQGQSEVETSRQKLAQDVAVLAEERAALKALEVKLAARAACYEKEADLTRRESAWTEEESIRQQALATKEQQLNGRETAVEKATAELAAKEQALAALQADVEKDRAADKALTKQVMDDAAKISIDLALQKADLDQREQKLAAKTAEVDSMLACLEQDLEKVTRNIQEVEERRKHLDAQMIAVRAQKQKVDAQAEKGAAELQSAAMALKEKEVQDLLEQALAMKEAALLKLQQLEKQEQGVAVWETAVKSKETAQEAEWEKLQQARAAGGSGSIAQEEKAALQAAELLNVMLEKKAKVEKELKEAEQQLQDVGEQLALSEVKLVRAKVKCEQAQEEKVQTGCVMLQQPAQLPTEASHDLSTSQGLRQPGHCELRVTSRRTVANDERRALLQVIVQKQREVAGMRDMLKMLKDLDYNKHQKQGDEWRLQAAIKQGCQSIILLKEKFALMVSSARAEHQLEVLSVVLSHALQQPNQTSRIEGGAGDEPRVVTPPAKVTNNQAVLSVKCHKRRGGPATTADRQVDGSSSDGGTASDDLAADIDQEKP